MTLQKLPEFSGEKTGPILIKALSDEIKKTGLKKAVLGVSGGIDSALSLVLAQKALGAENVHAVFMPYKLSSPASLNDAKELCEKFQIDYSVEEITAMADAYIELHPSITKLQIGNILARLRMIVLYDYSVTHQALVVGTSNKTETLVGYSTLWGDMASAVNPLGDLYKTQVRALSRLYQVPASIIDKAPSADLWPGQTDEGEMNVSYDVIDQILYHFMELHWPVEKILAACDGELKTKAEQILFRVKRSQFKRKMPIILKVSTRSVNREFRMPRDWGM